MTGDTTGVLDDSRVLIITPDAQLAGTINLPNASPALETPWAGSSPPSAADGLGRFYALASPIAVNAIGSFTAVDSAAILRWKTESELDTVGFLPVDVRGAQLIGRMVARAAPGPFAAAPAWTVAPDGRIAVVYPDPYHVAFYDSAVRRVTGARIPNARVKVTDGHKQAWRDEQQRPRPFIMRQRGGSGTTVIRTSLPFREPEAWPEYLPPFLSESARFAPDGRLWVQRTTAPAEDAAWDIFDHRGAVIEIVRAAQNTRLVGFGARHAYLVRRGANDVEYLERYVLR
jgi:hypothetical protein